LGGLFLELEIYFFGAEGKTVRAENGPDGGSAPTVFSLL
jgi:hypothetical protein